MALDTHITGSMHTGKLKARGEAGAGSKAGKARNLKSGKAGKARNLKGVKGAEQGEEGGRNLKAKAKGPNTTNS